MSESEMGNTRSTRYRGLMRSMLHTSKVAVPYPAAALVLVLSGASSCGDGDGITGDLDSLKPQEGGSAGASVAGAGGAGAAAGSGGGAGEPAPSAGAAGESVATGSGARGPAPGTGGGGGGGGVDIVAPDPVGVTPVDEIQVVYCKNPAECDDGVFCNGKEECWPRTGRGDEWICMRPLVGPCGPNTCDEEENACDCTTPDNDGDNYPVQGCAVPGEQFDCDDEDKWRNPGRTELCDPDDESQDPLHDEDCIDAVVGGDGDGDNYVDYRCGNVASLQPVPEVAAADGGVEALEMIVGRDCNDTRKDVHPDAIEKCDGVDNDCNGETDEVQGEVREKPATYYLDFDGDHYGDTAKSIQSWCLSPQAPYVNDHGDCDDTDGSIGPDMPEVCNGIDDNCDGKVDLSKRPGAPLVDMPFEDGMTFECGGKEEWLVTSCPPGRLECDDPSYRDACETIGTTMCNCHACGVSCNFSCGETACEEITEISTGTSHTCAIARPGSANAPGAAVCWGWNAHGQLGTGTIQNSSVPVLVEDLPRAVSIATGDLHSCAVANDRVYCWGYDDFGQLGYGLAIDSSATPLVAELPVGGAIAKVVAAGSKHTCAIYNSGLLACWGRGEDGQLGDDSSGAGHFRYVPTRVVRRVGGALAFVNDAAKVAGGTAHTCAVSVGGKVECWGSNEAGQIGQDPEAVPASAIALPVPGLENVVVDDIAAAGHLTCARSGSDVLCWGSNAFYELARDDVDFSSSPVAIPLPSAARSLAVGAIFGCAATASGSVYCWGSNFSGERGTTDPPGVGPSILAIDGVSHVFGGKGSHACAVRTMGAWCWGSNLNAQLGDGSSSEEMEPVARRVRGLNPACSNP